MPVSFRESHVQRPVFLGLEVKRTEGDITEATFIERYNGIYLYQSL